MVRDTPPNPADKFGGFHNDHHTTVLGAIYGFRAFDINRDSRLTGVIYEKPWTGGVNTAECFNPYRRPETEQLKADRGFGLGPYRDRRLEPIHPGPDDRSHNMKDCACGWWAFFSADMDNPFSDYSRVAAVVRLSGRSVIGTRGIRSVYAEIVAASFKPSYYPTPASVEALRRVAGNYPGVKWYPDIMSMLNEWPLSSKLGNYQVGDSL